MTTSSPPPPTQYAEAAQSSHPLCSRSSPYAFAWRAGSGAAPRPPQSSHSRPHASHEHSSSPLKDSAPHHAASPISIAHANSPPSSTFVVVHSFEDEQTIAAASLGKAVKLEKTTVSWRLNFYCTRSSNERRIAENRLRRSHAHSL